MIVMAVVVKMENFERKVPVLWVGNGQCVLSGHVQNKYKSIDCRVFQIRSNKAAGEKAGCLVADYKVATSGKSSAVSTVLLK